MSETNETRTMKAVDPAFVVVNHAGFGWRDLMVRMPQGAVADDLKEPSLWSRVQNERNFALRKHDHLYIVAYDESWAAEATVTHANKSEAILSQPRLISFGQPAKEKLGRFGHHPHPADDFCVEVDSLEGMAAEVRAGGKAKSPGFASRDELTTRISRALDFTVGGDEGAVVAKNKLRAIAAEFPA